MKLDSLTFHWGNENGAMKSEHYTDNYLNENLHSESIVTIKSKICCLNLS